ncbi:MAG: CoA transferase [Chloroflexi bacterium]|nr:CoA transferase [Chloroflexota bacterium]
MTAALSGIRIIDFGQYIAGPLAAVMLADNGAEVIHVDPPGGPRWRHPADAFYNRGKQRICLNLKDAADRSTATRLIESADAVIENFRPGVMERLGLSAAELCARLPRLIYCSIPGFASDDPRRGVPAWEGVVGAATDTYARVGQITTPADGDDAARPVYTALPLASNFAAFHAATAIVMALIARERDGVGQRIEVPMFDAMFELIGANGISVDGDYRMARSRGTSTYVCADGRRILFNSTSTPRFKRWFAAAAGTDTPTPELFLTRTAEQWEKGINTAGGPTAMVRTASEWLANEHARTRGTIARLDDPELGPTWMPGVLIHLSDSPGVIQPRHLPDADRAAVTAQLATLEGSAKAFRKTQEIDEHTSPSTVPVMSNGPLAGIRVLDLTQVVAGPCTGRILVEYGADVIKINDPHPESLTAAVSLSGRPTDPGNQQHEHLNRGKQTLLLDLHAPEAREVMDRLLERTDVLMQNFAFGQAQRYGISYEQLRQRRPEIVYFSLSAYGYGGPMQAYRGFEGNAQAAVGLMDRFGGDGPPLGQPYLLDDYGTGIRGAFAIGLGVYHRLKTGRGQHVNISLVETATTHSAAFLIEYEGATHTEPRGIQARGTGPLQRLYRASDAWLFVGSDSTDRLRNVAELSDLADVDPAALESALESRFATHTTADWTPRLLAAGIGAHRVERVEELMQDAWVRAHGLSLVQSIEGLGDMTMPGVAARMSRTPLRVGAAVRPPGADAPQILEAIGLVDRLDDLLASGAISMTEPSRSAG